jgi:hypothetical protein
VTGKRRKTGIRQEDQLSWQAERARGIACRWTGGERDWLTGRQAVDNRQAGRRVLGRKAGVKDERKMTGK